MISTSITYALTFSNGKRYIGQSKDPRNRFYTHKKRALTGSSKLYLAWRELGTPKYEEIFTCPDEHKHSTEKFFISLNNAINDGYNTVGGGAFSIEMGMILRAANLGSKRSKESREKMAKAQLGTHRSPEARAKISAFQRTKTVSQETRQRLSEAAKRRYSTC